MKIRKISLLLVLIFCFFGCSSQTIDISDNIVELPEFLELELDEDTTLSLIKITAGEFQMGSFEEIGNEDELPVRKITLTNDYLMGIYEVTQDQWEAVMGNNPSGFKGNNLPVETVSWEECMEFCDKLSEMTGYNVSLPTEAQWEYASRAGTDSKWFFGDDDTEYAKYATIDHTAKTLEVGSFEPNPNGLYDMYGNIQEWCLDYYSPEYLEDDLIDPAGPEIGDARVSRGGGWGASLDDCRSAYRNACGQNEATDGIGLRIVINP